MMREIKFRGLPTCKDKDELDYINFDRDGNFAVGFYEDGYIIGKVADASDDYISQEFWVAVDKNTVGQYTGLKDKNGREIYEGDIVEVTSQYWGMLGNRYEVKFKQGSFCVKHVLLSEISPSISVIGNVHESPELLEASK